MAGINQVQINPAVGLTFADGLRAFLSQDPNIILVGEIRDNETTELAIQAALTGHLVFSTLHTSNACRSAPQAFGFGSGIIFTGFNHECGFRTKDCQKNLQQL